MERTEFLARVREATTTARLPAPPPGNPGLAVPDLGITDPVETFRRAVVGVDGVVHDGDPIEAVREVVARHGPGPHITWEAELLPLPEASSVMEDAGPRLDAARREHRAGLRDAVYGVTGAEAGFAQSGTIVVRSGPGMPRMASLVPAVHVALLRRDRIVGSLAEWAEADASGMASAPNVVLVTGPSRTGDIEQQLTLGVHGPRHLHVILLDH